MIRRGVLAMLLAGRPASGAILLAGGATLLACLPPGGAAWAASGHGCPAAPVQALALPVARAALAEGHELLIAALGSSSTESLLATDTAHSYPAQLQADLSADLVHDHVAVVNRGIAGQDAAEELARLDTDVTALHPQIVIWQVGANSALRQIDPALFRRLVTAGVRRLQHIHTDVVLMDNQRAPRILASAEHLQMDQSLAEVAALTGASLFSRGQLMDAWAQHGAPYARFISPDGLHHNDAGYRCVAQALAAAILAGLAGK